MVEEEIKICAMVVDRLANPEARTNEAERLYNSACLTLTQWLGLIEIQGMGQIELLKDHKRQEERIKELEAENAKVKEECNKFIESALKHTNATQLPALVDSVELELPAGQDKLYELKIGWSEVKQGKLHLCVAIEKLDQARDARERSWVVAKTIGNNPRCLCGKQGCEKIATHTGIVGTLSVYSCEDHVSELGRSATSL